MGARWHWTVSFNPKQVERIRLKSSSTNQDHSASGCDVLTICIVCLISSRRSVVRVHYAAIEVETVTVKVTVQKTDDLARKVQHLNVFNRWWPYAQAEADCSGWPKLLNRGVK